MRALTLGTALAALLAGVALPAAAETEPVYRAGRYAAVTPVRLHDTRASSAIGPGGTVRIALGDKVPSDATAVVLTITVPSATATTQLTAYAAGAGRAGGTVQVRSGETRAAQLTVGIGGTAAVEVHNSAGQTHVIADLVGYYRAGGGAGFRGVTPVRASSQRGIPAKTTRTVDLSGHVPEGAVAAVLSITADAGSATHLTVWQSGVTRPGIGGLPLAAGEARTHLIAVALGTGRSISLYHYSGTVNAAVDLLGYYTPTGGAAYQARTPVREYDSRADYPSGLPGLPIPPNSRVSFSVSDSVPADATGVVLGVIGFSASETTALTLWADARSPRPEVTSVSVPSGKTVAGGVALGMRATDLVTVYNSAGRIHVAADLLGYFLAAEA
ncbi:hypothetical protein ACFQV2_39575 [Actinokineospora soli]|uniref:Uncharacterized protein n=1 Tax=Actinokineospora soli TaxID=1048753 RepID=A0ABW2TX97_9PSEU